MVHIFKQTYQYQHPWEQVTLAIFLKYPNPFASHVLASDTIERYIDSETGILHTTRLFLKKGSIPRWGRMFMSNSETYIIEHSQVDLKARVMQTATRNLSHTKLMIIEETQTIKPIDNDSTEISLKARIRSNTGWLAIKNRIEHLGLRKFEDNSERSSNGLIYVLEKIRERLN